MKSDVNRPVLIERKVIDTKTVESRIKIGKTVINVQSRFEGTKKYRDLLYDMVSRKFGA